MQMTLDHRRLRGETRTRRWQLQVSKNGLMAKRTWCRILSSRPALVRPRLGQCQNCTMLRSTLHYMTRRGNVLVASRMAETNLAEIAQQVLRHAPERTDQERVQSAP